MPRQVAKRKARPTAAQRRAAAALLRQYEAFAFWCVHRVLGLNEHAADYEDAVQEARCAIYDAALGFRPELGFQFKTYAFRAVRNRLGRQAEVAVRYGFKRVGDSRKLGPNRRQADRPWSLSQQIVGDFGAPTTLGATIAGPEPDAIWAADDDRARVWEAVGKLPERDRAIVLARVLDGDTLQAVADRLGVSKERVRQIQKDAMHRLRVDLVGGTA